MNNNYPIKYTIMPIMEENKSYYSINELERDYIVVYYIVSKCYLIKESKIYSQNGSVNFSYDIVYPYQEMSGISEFCKVLPMYNNEGECYNCDTVTFISNSYDEAKEKCDELNQKLYGLDKYNLACNKYEEYEMIIDNLTSGMIADNKKLVLK